MLPVDESTLKLMPVSREAIPSALSKAERYRFLNEPWQAESICRDVLAVDPTNEAALILLVLALADQLEQGVSSKEATHIVENLKSEYHRDYYSGILRERQAVALFKRNMSYRCRREAYTMFQEAMECYRKAQAIRPADNDDAVLRWNTCVRFLKRNWDMK